MLRTLVFALVALLMSTGLRAQDPLFSGPQVGEAMVPFEARGVFGPQAGKRVDVLGEKPQTPVVLVFVHQLTRPSIGLTRLVMEFANAKRKDGLKSELVFLSKDLTETEARLRRARHALPEGVLPVVATGGIEGPGAYGLNRKMAMTVLVGKGGKVTANFPLVQPSIQADGPKIGHAIVQVLGGTEQPTLEEMGFRDPRGMQRGNESGRRAEQDGIYRQKMTPVIRGLTREEVEQAALAVEDFAKKNAWFRQRVGKASNLIVNGGKLSNYGKIPLAREYLKKWAKEMLPEEPQASSPVPPDNATPAKPAVSTGSATNASGQAESP